MTHTAVGVRMPPAPRASLTVPPHEQGKGA